MTPTIEQIATAFSSHDFDAALPHLAADVRWNNVGGAPLAGRDAVAARCAESARYLATVATSFSTLRAVVARDCVVVESVATYTEPAGGVSTVASCDVYDFAGGAVVAITSYNVELPPA